jgi:hypothetical protein
MSYLIFLPFLNHLRMLEPTDENNKEKPTTTFSMKPAFLFRNLEPWA